MPVPKGFHWGVDSTTPINALLNEVIRTKGVPEFWGRYLSRFAVTEDEIRFLRRHSPSTRLLLIFNPLNLGFFQDKPANPVWERSRGFNAALAARAAADALDPLIPKGTGIYVNMEKDSEKEKVGIVSADWILGWWEGMRNSKFGFGGIYGNVSEFNPNNNVAFSGDAYAKALPAAPGILKPLWSQFPHNKPPVGPAKMNFGFTPGEPPKARRSVEIWQYFATTKKGSFDMNLASDRAFKAMWKVSHSIVQKQDRGGLEEQQNNVAPERPGSEDAEYQSRHRGA